MEKGREEAVLRHFPIGSETRTLLAYFRSRLKFEKAVLRSFEARRMDLDWYVKYSPKSYMPIMEYEARHRVYSFLIMALRTHASAFARRPDHRKWNHPKLRYRERNRFTHATDALDAVGVWWIEWNKGRIRPHVTRPQRRAFETCARIHRILARGTRNVHEDAFTKRFTAYLEWETRRLNEQFLSRPNDEE